MCLIKKLTMLFLCLSVLISSVAVSTITVSANSTTGTALSTGDVFTFGYYPQTRITDESLIQKLNSLDGVWKSYNYYDSTGNQSDFMQYKDITYSGNKYRAVTFSAYRRGATEYLCDTIYWFLYEPLQWRLLDAETGLAICEQIVDAQPYHHTSATTNGYYANNYEQSDIRNWLTHTFYNTAFSSYNKSCILTKQIDNTACATSVQNVGSYTQYSSKSTQDSVFLLSKSEADTYASSYFKTSVTDYAYSNGFVPGSGTAPSNHWLLRTAGNNTYQVWYVQIRWGVHTTYYNWYDDALQTLMGIRPAIYLDSDFINNPEFDHQQNIGILKDYVISINLDGSGVNGISEITVNDMQYPVKQGVLNLTQAKKLQNKKVFFSYTDGLVDSICDLDETTIPELSINDEIILTYKNGKFPDKKFELLGGVSNRIINSIDVDFAKSIAALSLTNVTVELLSSNPDVIYFKENSNKQQSIKFNLNENILAGNYKQFSQKVYVNTGYSFSKDREYDNMKITCLISARKNGKYVTDVCEIPVKLVNGDFGHKKNWKTQSVDELLEQMQKVLNDISEGKVECPVLTSQEAFEIILDINAIKASDSLSNFQNNYELLEFTYDMGCYFYDLKYPTIGDAGAAFLDAIISECETASSDLKSELKTVLQSLTNSHSFSKFIHWYNNENQVALGNKKKIEPHCPVDVIVTDEDGDTVLSIINDDVIYSAENAVGFVCDSKKTIYLPTDIDHQIQIIATDDGTMNYSVTEYSSTDGVSVVSYSDIPLTKDKVCSGYVTRDSMPSENAYALTEMTLDKLSFAGASITLHNDIAISFNVDEALFTEVGYTAPYVLFEMNGEKFVVSNYRNFDGKYVFDFNNVSPNKMNDTIKATLYATHDGVIYQSETKEYSVAKYCYNMLETYTSDEYSELRTLLVDLLNYGADSQIYTGHNTENLVNAALTDEQKAWGTADTPELDSVLNTKYETVEKPTAQWKGAGLVLNNSITLRFMFTADNAFDLTAKISTDSDSWVKASNSFKYENGLYYVYFSGLHAAQMSENIYLTLYDGDTPVSDTVLYSIESYAYSKQNGTDEKLAALVNSMMKYGKSAYAYAN